MRASGQKEFREKGTGAIIGLCLECTKVVDVGRICEKCRRMLENAVRNEENIKRNYIETVDLCPSCREIVMDRAAIRMNNGGIKPQTISIGWCVGCQTEYRIPT